jgi:hypothetical protein
VSHAPEREEKNCLNCGTTVIGRFCHVCGQENLEPKESFWHLVTHFFNDITHFDGKFFVTLKDLLLRPGFLSKQYMIGRRVSYLNPVRMYVFTSAIFFLLFFSFLQKDESFQPTISVDGKALSSIMKMDSASFAAFTAHLDSGGKPMTRQQFEAYVKTNFNSGFHIKNANYNSRKEYDSLLASGKISPGWLERQVVYKQIAINQKYNNNSQQILAAFVHTLLHSLPQMFFLSLPLLAFILKLMYIRRKQFYYVSHGIFSIHLYVFLFIAMLVSFGVSKINEGLQWGLLKFVSVLLILGMIAYEYMALKNFYRQGRLKTFIKFLLVNILFSIVVGFLFVIFILFSFFNI